MTRKFTIENCTLSDGYAGIYVAGPDVEFTIKNTQITGNVFGIKTEDVHSISSAIEKKPEAEQPRLRAMLTDLMSGTAAGVTVEVLKKQLGL
ncbi:hypothetical protein [Sphingomonas sp.]|uniref:hypothetical protein n=1 Tax=Sphingomonas sp. TaxID=28214 RepID=UPI0025F2E1E5|nr:hypothetical protein [Sphingomonas sp.]